MPGSASHASADGPAERFRRTVTAHDDDPMRGSIDATVETYDGPTVSLTAELCDLYGVVYAEPPYCDGPADVAEFVAEWPELVARSGFRLAVARVGAGGLAGFALGHAVDPDSGWWPGERSASAGAGAERGGWDRDPSPGFGVAELGVHPAWRRRGLASLVHEALLAGRTEPWVVLWVRGDAPAAVAMYHRWGYRLVGAVPDRPPYQVMCLARTAGSRP
jgi:ribosomal protein S18 acetylase RimI-like enzyme